MMGMVWQWVWFYWDGVDHPVDKNWAYNTLGAGSDFACIEDYYFDDGYFIYYVKPGLYCPEFHVTRLQAKTDYYFGLRLARNKE